MNFKWFKLKEFGILAILIWVSYIVADWGLTLLGLGDLGIISTLLALGVPPFIVYWAWKTWLKPYRK